MHRQYLHLGTRTLAYFDSAPTAREAPVLVLVHAFPLGAGMWDGQEKALPDGWRLLAPDLRGFGGSTIGEPDDEPAIDDYARDVIDLLSELGISRVVLGGCSMGGYAVLATLRRAPELARALILVDTRATADSPEGRANRRSMLALLEREGPSGVGREMLPKLLGDTTRQQRPEIEPLVRRLIKGQSPAALRGAILRMMQRPDARDLLPTLHLPTLIVVGEEDELTPPADARVMADAIDGATLEIVPHAGHLPNLEQPELFNRTLRAFLSQL